MRSTFFIILTLAFAVTGSQIANAKGAKKTRDTQRTPRPVYLHNQPVRIKPVFEKPQFETSKREKPNFAKSQREKSIREPKGIEKRVRVRDKREQPLYSKTVLETKWTRENDPVMEPVPVEKKSDTKVHQGWFRDLRAP